jgi:hypothetical protein
MKRVIGVACIAALVCGCAGPSRPKTGPGSGYGANYVPSVEANPASAEAYDASLTKCQGWARDLPYLRSGQHDVALNILGVWGTGSYLTQTPLTGIWEAWGLVPLVAGGIGFAYWMESPERERWYASQETMMMNCMAREGYVNNDSTVTVTWVKPNRTNSYLRPVGRDTYNAERLAKRSSCSATPLATLVDKGPGFEIHKVACTSGQTMTIRCEFGNCRASDRIASN